MLEQGQYQSGNRQNDRQSFAKTEEKMTRNQKIAISGLVFFGLCTFVFWASQLRSSLTGPFNNFQDDGTDINGSTTADSIDLNKDTDGDSLPDYEETNVYNTSPYLADTDSDGILDGKEIADSTDPNCPQGRDCFSGATSTDIISVDSQNTSQFVVSSSSMGTVDINKAMGVVATSTTDKNLTNLMSGNVSATELRQMLQQSGMDKAMLDGISDDLLMSTFKDTLKTQTSN